MKGNKKKDNDRQNMQFLIYPFLLLRTTHCLLPLFLKLLLDQDPQVKLNMISNLDVIVQGNSQKKNHYLQKI